MNVILLEPINRLGDLGDEVAVKPGFARNYLLPQGKAVRATAENREVFEQRRAELQKLAEARLAEAGDRGKQLAAANVTIVVKAGEEGKLYGSVGAQEIANALAEQGIEIHKREIILSEGAFRVVGDYEVTVRIHSEVSVSVPISVVAE